MSDESVAEGNTVIKHAVGLHARPAVKLTQLAARFRAEINLRAGEAGDWVNAKSIAKVMKLKARTSATLYFRAEGEDAGNAVRELVDLVERNFDEPSG